MKQNEISDFYDEYVQRQIKTGANERLISLYKRLLNGGLNADSKVLELGCGVGIFTKLLAKKVKNGIIEAVDLSEKSVAVAKNELKDRNNIHFDVADVVKYQPKNSDFDMITLMDVIEHIPLEHHAELFANLAKIATEKTNILINIPNPQYIGYARINHPESLQVIDQEVELFTLMQHLEQSGLELIYFEKYGIWEQDDYHFMVIRKKRNFELKHLSDQRNFSKKIFHKLTTKIDAVKYK
ncbi:bifunctional 2-polyprenyl-6-hydroxyphenol methylase/3-demethylubiquinol 3-O-methyltransferase UbiG [Chryseobacterium sp. HSC-36S06]|uniref:class I SAM-dependent methyltransferase n=1 Tax=Chryseobacterium sp. HSC-36S06 TaxID=2910970 RepID=UPI00209EEB90|nr:class I SAM-dependent methyltransferase [Chryseobacterium sp. HSC-36S06]MCP2037204.1 2-polyprenyl-3-methyl-5-hydroxy-6-metoxy-1,4-benzoquinol methylase [Chryseobacterium sp. HSC-36S06]